MKKFFTILAISLASIASGYADENSTSTFNPDAIKQALKVELSQEYLKCRYRTIQEERPSYSEFANKLTGLINTPTATVTVSSDLSQPVLVVSVPYDANTRQIIVIETNTEFTKITNLKKATVYSESAKVNTGTILNPVFETKIVDKTVLDFICTSK